MMFKLTTEQHNKLADWIASHEERYAGSIGGRYTYTFTPTSIGMVVKVIDNITHEEIDLTNYDW